MIDPFARTPARSDDAVARSRDLSLRALNDLACDGGSICPNETLSMRLDTLRTSLDRIADSAPGGRCRLDAPALRLGLALAAMPSGERRRAARWPLLATCRLRLNGRSLHARTLDIGAGGLMLAPVPAFEPGEQAVASVEFSPGARWEATIAIDADGIGHLAFTNASACAAAAALSGVLRRCADDYDRQLRQVAALASLVTAHLERALHAGDLDIGGLFTAAKPGAATQNLFSGLLPLLLRATTTAGAAPAYLAAVDREGHIVGEAEGRHWLSGRAGQCLGDVATMRAARFSRHPIVQACWLSPEGARRELIADLSAPVVVRGRRWGCIRVGRSPVSLTD